MISSNERNGVETQLFSILKVGTFSTSGGSGSFIRSALAQTARLPSIDMDAISPILASPVESRSETSSVELVVTSQRAAHLLVGSNYRR